MEPGEHHGPAGSLLLIILSEERSLLAWAVADFLKLRTQGDFDVNPRKGHRVPSNNSHVRGKPKGRFGMGADGGGRGLWASCFSASDWAPQAHTIPWN